jgi:hypothetical protein
MITRLSTTRLAAAAALAVTTFAAQAAPTCMIGAGNVGLTSVACSFDDATNTITIREVYGNAGAGSVELRGLVEDVAYKVVKVITNNSGVNFDRVANELLDPAGDNNDSLDPAVQPGFVPAGYTTSNNSDGLSFAQGFGIPRNSDVFANVLADELSDNRDFLDFFGGVLLAGGVGTLNFGLIDQAVGGSINQPFLLFQRPNASSVPEPMSLMLVGVALAAAGMARRRRSA